MQIWCYLVVIFSFFSLQANICRDLAYIQSVEDLIALFPRNAEYIERAVDIYMDDVRSLIEQLKNIPDCERTFENSIKLDDYISNLSDLSLFRNVLNIIKSLHPECKMREAATAQILRISRFFADLHADKSFWHVFKAYMMDGAFKEELSQEQRYHLDKIQTNLRLSGIDLPDEQLKRLTAIKKELADLTLLFAKNIDEDECFITVDEQELDGVSPEFIATLKKDEQGNYMVGIDNPTISQILDHATNAGMRKRFCIALNNRAYPANVEVLEKIVAKRHELAQLLGFTSFAELSLERQMVKSPERAAVFIDNIIEHANIKAQIEFDELIAHLPEGITLSSDGKMYPWDVRYCKTWLKKQYYNIDERMIAEYFPVAHTLQGMLDIYAAFFSLRFQAEQINDLWVDDLTLLTVYSENQDRPIGYIILDLYPRADKFSHAACNTIIPATYQKDGTPTIAVAQIMANFPSAQGDKPALFTRSDVITFFHEFGHALHALLGRTVLASASGLHVKTDFMEMPSQMLEEWMRDGAMLKKISRHYMTGEQLPDELLESMHRLHNFNTGTWVQDQARLASFSLKLFGPEQPIDSIDALWARLTQDIIKNRVYMPENRYYTSFLHLTGYGAKYYGYLWSQVFALDLFNEIKKHGLLNPEIGKRYVTSVLGRGGSADPYDLITDFLGREPSADAFFKDMGI